MYHRMALAGEGKLACLRRDAEAASEDTTMMLQHLLTGTRVLVGLLWSLGLVFAGSCLLAAGELPAGFPPPAVLASGAAAVVAGQFVFMVIVADRLFPSAWPRAVAICEWLAAGIVALILGGTLAYAALLFLA